MNLLLGPVLVLAGMFLLELLTLRLPGPAMGEKAQRWAASSGELGAALLGVVFALTFCPVSAALFFGSMLPVALRLESRAVVPAVYGVGTALPVVVFAVLIALGARSIGTAFNRLAQFEAWARRVTGIVFIGVGIFLSLRHIWGVLV